MPPHFSLKAKAKYEGANGTFFWERISALSPEDQRVLRPLAILLVNTEAYVLKLLERAELERGPTNQSVSTGPHPVPTDVA
jgi:hypothetical protein